MSTYDKIYSGLPNYNDSPCPAYIPACLDFCRRNDGLILDAGCGKGHWMRMLGKNGIKTFGIEPSKYCCDHFLGDLSYSNDSILSFQPKGTFAGVICMGVLEHIKDIDLDANLLKLATLSRNALFGIGSHSDVLLGIELHLIIEDAEWWRRRLLKFYEGVDLRYTTSGTHLQYFTFELKNPIPVDSQSSRRPA